MRCVAMNSCANQSVFRWIDFCREGISECCRGLESVSENNIRNGIEQIRNGACICVQGLTNVQNASRQINVCNSLIRRQVQRGYQQLCNIRLGQRDIMQNNVKMGSDVIKDAICSLEQLIEELTNYFEQANGSCDAC